MFERKQFLSPSISNLISISISHPYKHSAEKTKAIVKVKGKVFKTWHVDLRQLKRSKHGDG